MQIPKDGTAVFFDRDGVITKPVFSEKFGEYQPPHSPADVVFYDETISVLKDFMTFGIPLIIVSNQPDAAKGKALIEDLYSVSNYIKEIFNDNGIFFSEYYYCYHHPEGIIPEFSVICDCRKPNNKFLIEAVKKYSLIPEKCWMAGDRNTDIEFGKSLGLKTVYLDRGLLYQTGGKNFSLLVKPDFIVPNLRDCYNIINNCLS